VSQLTQAEPKWKLLLLLGTRRCTPDRSLGKRLRAAEPQILPAIWGTKISSEMK